MQLLRRVKQAGRKRDLIGARTIDVGDIGARTLVRVLLTAVVRQQVTAYNERHAEENLLPFISATDIAQQAVTGKVGFGKLYNENKADVNMAIDTALQAFEDGLFSLFVDEDECTSLDQPVVLTSSSTLTFIRLTFLAGSFW